MPKVVRHISVNLGHSMHELHAALGHETKLTGESLRCLVRGPQVGAHHVQTPGRVQQSPQFAPEINLSRVLCKGLSRSGWVRRKKRKAAAIGRAARDHHQRVKPDNTDDFV